MDPNDSPYLERDFSSMSLKELQKIKRERRILKTNNEIKLKEIEQRKWIRNNNKDHYLDFDENVVVLNRSIVRKSKHISTR